MDRPEQPAVDVPLAADGREFRVTCVSMGNPHCVVFVDEPTDDWVLGVGPQLEADPHFPKRVNVEFAKVMNGRELQQRTWERGSGE
ncbi:MAG: diaminopimelate epimerase, partial [Pirellulales bacterium]